MYDEDRSCPMCGLVHAIGLGVLFWTIVVSCWWLWPDLTAYVREVQACRAGACVEAKP